MTLILRGICAGRILAMFPRLTSALNLKNIRVLQHYGWRHISTKNEPLNISTSYVHIGGSEPLQGKTIGNLVEEAAILRGDSEAIVDIPGNIRKTFAQIHDEVDRLAAGFLTLGLLPGDRIGLLGPNSYHWYVMYFAAARAGLVLVSLNYTFKEQELKYCINKVGMKALVCAEELRGQKYYELLLNLAPAIGRSTPGKIHDQQVPTLKTVIVASKERYQGTFTLDDMFCAGKADHAIKELQCKIQFDDPCNIHFTSGTTGAPKATTLTHHGIVNNSYFMAKRREFCAKDILCLGVPMFHAYGSIGFLLCGMHAGMSCVIPTPTFDARAALRAIEQEKCTLIAGTPAMYVDMMNILDETPHDVSTLRAIAIGAAPSLKEQLLKIKDKLGNVQINVGFGMTETGVASFIHFPNDPIDNAINTVGFPLEHVEVKVIDPDGKTVPVDCTGELCVRGYLTMIGYWDDPIKTEQVMSHDKWFKTGDLFAINKNGYGRCVGRLKDMLIRGGENIFPREIEDVLVTHPDIIDAQVVGVPDERLGEEVCAWIRVNDRSKLKENDVQDFCRSKMAYYKVPRYVLFGVEFPKTATGKVHKLTLAENAKKILNL